MNITTEKHMLVIGSYICSLVTKPPKAKVRALTHLSIITYISWVVDVVFGLSSRTGESWDINHLVGSSKVWGRSEAGPTYEGLGQ